MTMTDISTENQLGIATPNAVQLNIVAVVDTEKACSMGTLTGNLYLMDNGHRSQSYRSQGQGTASLSTACTRGQAINWIIYPIAGSFPSISNIAFVERDVCTRLEIYGAPDIPNSPAYLPGLTPSYSYWAGLVLPDLPVGCYRYRLEIKIGDTVLYTDTPSLKVHELAHPIAKIAP